MDIQAWITAIAVVAMGIISAIPTNLGQNNWRQE
jgi:hypothetical protein